MSNFDRNWRPAPREAASSHLVERVDDLRVSLRAMDPELISARSGIPYLSLGPGRGELHCPFWGKLVTISWPNLNAYDDTDVELPAFQQALFLYHLLTADGTARTGRWVSFADLPGGRMYSTAFQGYTGDEVSKAFALNLEGFKAACEKSGAYFVETGDAAYGFQPLPRVELLVVYHLGDEDFPSSCKILFDSSATHYLPIDGCAVVGSMLVKKILSAAKDP